MSNPKDSQSTANKIPYSTPQLTVFGSVAHTTQANMKSAIFDNPGKVGTNKLS